MELWEMMHAYIFPVIPGPCLITEYKFSGYPCGCAVETISFPLIHPSLHEKTGTYMNTWKRTLGRGVPGKSPCIINCRPPRREEDHSCSSRDIPRCRGALRSRPHSNTLSHSICSLSPRICISARLMKLLPCLDFWQIPGNMCTSHTAPLT